VSTVAVPSPLVVGFDLDMTLIDTVPGFRDVLVALGPSWSSTSRSSS
jgi:hypothetical protein